MTSVTPLHKLSTSCSSNNQSCSVVIPSKAEGPVCSVVFTELFTENVLNRFRLRSSAQQQRSENNQLACNQLDTAGWIQGNAFYDHTIESLKSTTELWFCWKKQSHCLLVLGSRTPTLEILKTLGQISLNLMTHETEI